MFKVQPSLGVVAKDCLIVRVQSSLGVVKNSGRALYGGACV